MAENALTSWLATLGVEQATATSNGARLICPFHQDSGQSLRVVGTYFRCYSSRCGVHGPLAKLAEHFGQTVPDWVMDGQQRLVVSKQELVEIPRYRLEAYARPFAFMRARGIPDHETEAWEVRTDHRKGAGTVLIPLHDPDGRIVSCAWRYASGARRYVNLKGMPRERMLYGLHRVPPEHDKLILVEGFADAWKCWAAGYPAVSTYGAVMSPGQVQLLADRGHRSVIVMYDNDDAGYAGAIRAHKLMANHIEVRFAMRYLGVWPKDPGDANKVVFRRLLASTLDLPQLHAQRKLARKFNSFRIKDKMLQEVLDD